jgi:hypothetical protein
VEVFGVTVADADVPPNQRTNEVAPTVAGGLLRVGRIYLESAMRDYARGRDFLALSCGQLVQLSPLT